MEEGGIGAIVVFRNNNWLYRMVAERLGRAGTEPDCVGVLLFVVFMGWTNWAICILGSGLGLAGNRNEEKD